MLENVSASGAGIWLAFLGMVNALGWFVFSWWWKRRIFGRMLREIAVAVARLEGMLDRMEELARNEGYNCDAGIEIRSDE